VQSSDLPQALKTISNLIIFMETEIRVGDCMRKGIIVLDSFDTVYNAAKIMHEAEVGSVIVTKKNKAVGIATERDIVRKVVAKKRDPKTTKLDKIMSTPLRVISINSSIREAALAMKKYGIKKLPVMGSKKKIIGIITESDVLIAYPSLVDVLIEQEIIKRYDTNLADLTQYSTTITK